jgi:DNA-binding NtrC family response regulator
MSDRLCLIVDDEPAIRRYLQAVLKEQHLQTVEANDAIDALRVVNQLGSSLDLILSDVKMPGDMNGVDLAHSVRSAYPAIPIILISGYSDSKDADTAGFELIPKPFLPETILAAVERAIHSGEQGVA